MIKIQFQLIFSFFLIFLSKEVNTFTIPTSYRSIDVHRSFNNERLSPLVYSDKGDATADWNQKSHEKTSLEEELDRLQQTLTSIEALEERNKAQLDSFVDEEDQWNSMEEFERELLQSKDEVVERMEKMAEELMQMWMGAKSMEG